MSSNQYSENYQFTIKVISVKLKIKFPCKMTLEINKLSVVDQPRSSESNHFHFNQTVRFTGNGGSNNFQISVVLYTQKGTKYVSGVAKLLGAELIRSKGERLIIPLVKCLDPDAFCEIVVQSIDKKTSAQTRIKSKRQNQEDLGDMFSPEKKQLERIKINETKSEINPSKHVGFASLRAQQYGYKDGAKSQVYKTFSRSPNNKNFQNRNLLINTNFSKLKSQFPPQHQEALNSFPTSNALQTEVYRQGYQKLKQKFKKQSEVAKEENHKRLILQANQNNYKLQIMRLKLKCEQQQKLLTEKTQKHRHLNSQLMQLQKKDLDLDYLKQQNQSLEHRLKISDQKIVMLVNDASSLKLLMQQKSQLHKQNLQTVKQQLQATNNRLEQIKNSSELQLKAKQFQLVNKENDLRIRNEFIERQRKIIKQLQQQAEIKMFQYQKIISNQRIAAQTKTKEFKIKISSLEEIIAQMTLFQKQAVQQQRRLEDSIVSLEYKNKIREEQIESMNLQILQLRQIKEKYFELLKETKFGQQQLASLKKHLQNSLEDKASTLHDIVSKYNQEKSRYLQQKEQIQSKLKASQKSLMEVQAIVQQQKKGNEKELRKNEHLAKDIAQLRQSNKTYVQSNKLLQIKVLQLEQALSIYRNNQSERQLNLHQQRHKQQKQKLLKEIKEIQENLGTKQEQLNQTLIKNRQLTTRLSQAEQKLQKLDKLNKNVVQKLQTALKDQEKQNQQLITKNKAKSVEIQQLINKINEYQFVFIHNRENIQREKKSYKILEEKFINYQKMFKQKSNDLQALNLKYKELEDLNHEKQNQKAKLIAEKQQINVILSKKQKMIEIVNRDLSYARNQIESFKKTLKQKASEEQSYRLEIQEKGQECGVLKAKMMKIEKEYLKFKQFMAQLLKNELTKINTLPQIETSRKMDERLNESRASVTKSEASHKNNIDAAYLSNLIQQKMQQTKKNMWKIIEVNKLLRQQNDKLMQKTQEQSSKYEYTQLQLHRDIQLLQQQMSNIMNDKQIQSENYDNLLMELNFKIKETEAENQDLRVRIEQFQAIVEGLKIEFSLNNDGNQKKTGSLKVIITQLNEKIQYSNLNITCLEDKVHELQEKVRSQQTQIVDLKQMLMRNQKTILDAKQLESKLCGDVELLRKQLKVWQQKCMEYDLGLKSQQQTKEKYKSMLEQQQNKNKRLNEFINELIVQKQKVIKVSLEKSEQNNNLQNKLFELNHHKQLLAEQNEALKSKIEINKQQIKNHHKNIKTLQKQVNEQKHRGRQAIQKIKQKQNDLEIKKQYIKIIEEKYHELLNKNYKQIKELTNELDDKDLATYNLKKQLHQQISKIQTQNKSLWQQNAELNAEIQQLHLQLMQEKNSIQDLQLQLKQVKEQRNDYEDECKSKQFLMNSKLQEIKRLQCLVEEQKLYIQRIQSEQDQNQRQFSHNINQLTNDNNFKMLILQKELQQQLDRANKQYLNSAQRCKQLQEQNKKLQMGKHSIDFQHQQVIKNYEDKLKMMESERYNAILEKNKELKHSSQESKNYFNKIKQKEGQMRKLMLEVEQHKNLINKLQIQNSHSQQNYNHKIALLEKEICSRKQKEQNSHAFKNRINSILHLNQIEVRNIISQTIKRIIEEGNRLDSDKIYSLTKGLQSSVVTAMMAQLDKQ